MNATVVIPQRKNTRLTKALVKATREHNPGFLPIIVVNDDPDDKPEIDQVMIVKTGGAGVTAAWNMGCGLVETEFIVLLNNDIICLGPYIKKLVDTAAAKGIAGAKARKDRTVRKVVLEGWCLVFRTELWKKLDGFDPKMQYYFQDTDFQLRALQAGAKIKVVDVPLRHLGHRTAHDRSILPKKSRLLTDDGVTFRRKWISR